VELTRLSLRATDQVAGRLVPPREPAWTIDLPHSAARALGNSSNGRRIAASPFGAICPIEPTAYIAGAAIAAQPHGRVAAFEEHHRSQPCTSC
jgi:hypothetical protein